MLPILKSLSSVIRLSLCTISLFRKAISAAQREKRQGRALTLEEEQRFKSACNRHQYGDYFLFILATGLRKGEARALLN